MANKRNGTLYTGVTSDLGRRVYLHKHGSVEGFALRYGCRLLVYYEAHQDMTAAIAREKQIKAGSRRKKLALIEGMNPEWKDLYAEIWPARRRPAPARPRHCDRERQRRGKQSILLDRIASSGESLLAMTRNGSRMPIGRLMADDLTRKVKEIRRPQRCSVVRRGDAGRSSRRDT
jgi:putative endonuclease